MKLVSTVKLQKTKARAERSKPYFDKMYATVTSMLAKSGTIEHPYLKPQPSSKKAVILITSNRGLAGGYNANVIKAITGSDLKKEDIVLFTVGSKGKEYFQRREYTIAKEYNEVIENPMFSDAREICEEVLKLYTSGEVGEIYLAYTYFKNTVVHEPKLLKLLPVEVDEADIESARSNTLMNYEPAEEEALEIIIPKYMNSILYGALVEAVASENGARMQAMDAATSNAEDMIGSLTLQYNRARQGSITQELTEIIAGANAIS
jgi:F-type H+-transporting ATPase subunit gamma